MVIMTFIRQSALDIRRKLQCLDEVLGINSFQLVDVYFTIYHFQEKRKLKLATMFSETGKTEERLNPKREKPTKYQSMCLLQRGRSLEKGFYGNQK